MFHSLHASFQLLAHEAAAGTAELASLEKHFGSVPQEYVDLVLAATQIELAHSSGQYIRIWAPATCIEMDDGYGIRKRLPGAIPIGDDGGGQVIFYRDGKHGFGLYHVGYGNLDPDDEVWIAPSLTALLTQAIGIQQF